MLLAAGTVGLAISLHLQRQSSTRQFEDSAQILAVTLLDSLEHAMLQAMRDDIRHVVTDIASGDHINEVVIVSNTQRVFASGVDSEVGETRNDKELAQALASGETITRNKKQYGRDELSVILPVMNKPDCHTCHSSEVEVLGAIEVGIDRAPLDDQLREQTLLMVLIGGLTLTAVGGALALTLRASVINPLSKLGGAARRFAAGDFSTRVHLNKKDELGRMARTFNEMAEQVEQYAGDLESSRSKLQEKTEQVQEMATVRGQLLKKLVSAQEEERRRIARELHDEAGQALTTIMLNLARTIDALPDEAVEAKERLSQSRSLASRALVDLRKMIYDLRPEVLDQLGLVPALRSYVKSHLETKDIKAEFRFLGLKNRLSPQVEVTLFRVIQEAITNIIRHSGASMVNIQVEASKSGVTATVEDNGTGFDVESVLQATESWGLRGIRERVAILGGDLIIESGVQQGTRLQVQIPLKGEANE